MAITSKETTFTPELQRKFWRAVKAFRDFQNVTEYECPFGKILEFRMLPGQSRAASRSQLVLCSAKSLAIGLCTCPSKETR